VEVEHFWGLRNHGSKVVPRREILWSTIERCTPYCRSVLCSFLVSPSLIFIPIMSLSNFPPAAQTIDTQTEVIDFVSCLLEYAPPPTLIPLRCVPTHSSVSFDVQGHTCLIAEFRALFNFTQQNEHDLTMSTYLECSNQSGPSEAGRLGRPEPPHFWWKNLSL